MIFCGQPPAKYSQGRKGEKMKQKPKPDVVLILHHTVKSIIINS